VGVETTLFGPLAGWCKSVFSCRGLLPPGTLKQKDSNNYDYFPNEDVFKYLKYDFTDDSVFRRALMALSLYLQSLMTAKAVFAFSSDAKVTNLKKNITMTLSKDKMPSSPSVVHVCSHRLRRRAGLSSSRFRIGEDANNVST
jgi:hypothetical protein